MMNRFLRRIGWLARGWAMGLLACVVCHGTFAATESAPPRELTWDETEKTYFGKPGETEAKFIFTVKNQTDAEVSVDRVAPSCGCTTVEMPPTPWTLAPGASRQLRVVVDIRDKRGDLEKTLRVDSSLGEQTLLLRLFLPGSLLNEMRARSQRIASADRQAVFRGDCARCHVPPPAAASGEALFKAACAICHETPHRAEMVPDLAQVRDGRDAAFWTQWIAAGKEGSLMPAFARTNGGIFSPEQIERLVDYLTRRFPDPPAAK